MAQAMKKMGVKQEEINATEVIIKCSDKELIIKNPQVMKVNMMGQESLQITGDITEKEVSSEVEISKDDIETVMTQTGVSEEEAVSAIKKHNGDLAAAIMELGEAEEESQ